MKKLFSVLIAINFAFMMNANGQTTQAVVNIQHVIETPGTVFVPIDANFDMGTTIGGFDLTISFDENILTFIDLANIAPEVAANITFNDNGDVLISWFDASGADNLNGKLLDLEFDYQGGFSNILFLPEEEGVTEITDQFGNIVNAEFFDGSINDVASIPITGWSIVLVFGLIFSFVLINLRKIY